MSASPSRSPRCHEIAGTGINKDPAAALQLYARGCELAPASSCSAYGVALQGVDGIGPDLARARAALEKACKAGSADGCAALGALLDDP